MGDDMKKLLSKIFIVLNILSLSYIYFLPSVDVHAAAPIIKEAVKVVVKKELKQKTKSIVESQLVKSGVQTAEKTALEKANARWFQRMPESAVASLQESAARAVPSATPGWLKTVVGATMFATGADLAYDIYDYLKGGNEVPFYSDNADLFTGGRLLASGGYSLAFELGRAPSGQIKSKPYLMSDYGNHQFQAMIYFWPDEITRGYLKIFR